MRPCKRTIHLGQRIWVAHPHLPKLELLVPVGANPSLINALSPHLAAHAHEGPASNLVSLCKDRPGRCSGGGLIPDAVKDQGHRVLGGIGPRSLSLVLVLAESPFAHNSELCPPILFDSDLGDPLKLALQYFAHPL